MRSCIPLTDEPEPPRWVVTLQYEAGSADEAWKIGQAAGGDKAVRVGVYKNYFARNNRNPSAENKLAAPATYLAVLEFVEEPTSAGDLESKGKVAGYKLLKAFGEIKAAYE